jgi:4-hydroxybutyryl-CoA dehydratase / vinylacetyl-CoA-Delta-isomerase
MAIKTPREYVETLKDGRVVFSDGKRVNDVTTDKYLKLRVGMHMIDYAFAFEPKYRDIFVEEDEDGEPVSFVYVPARNANDLLRRREIIQLVSRTCYGFPGGAKFTGIDALNALTVVSRRIDKAVGTKYIERVEKFRKLLMKNDLSVVAAVSDVKGDRSLRPSKQIDHQDYYVHVVDRRPDGLVVRGAKTHISGAPCANEILVIPSRRHTEEDKDYAVSFSIPANTKGVTIINSSREISGQGNDFDDPIFSVRHGGHGTVIFDDVFVPMERVFLNGETVFSGEIAYMFGDFHRLSGDAYKYAQLEIMIGAAALMAEYNGLEKANHIRNKLATLVIYCEGVEALGRQACVDCVLEPEFGLAYPNPLISNTAKYFFANYYHESLKLVEDIAGGLVVTSPSGKDFDNPETRDLIKKYFGGKHGIPSEHRLRMAKLVKDLGASDYDVCTIHAEGSLEAQRMSVYTLADFDRYKAAARRVARIDQKPHELFANLPKFPVPGFH